MIYFLHDALLLSFVSPFAPTGAEGTINLAMEMAKIKDKMAKLPLFPKMLNSAQMRRTVVLSLACDLYVGRTKNNFERPSAANILISLLVLAITGLAGTGLSEISIDCRALKRSNGNALPI
ncbi:MAG: hypothetical protein ACOC2L_01055 [Candidatus Sumerlaeota bacterium]